MGTVRTVVEVKNVLHCGVLLVTHSPVGSDRPTEDGRVELAPFVALRAAGRQQFLVTQHNTLLLIYSFISFHWSNLTIDTPQY